MKFINKNNCFAFTLAEVLITLGIIGIVAAITIPTLINNSQKAQYVTQLKEFYSTMNQTLKQMANDAGCPSDLSCTGFFDGTDDKAIRNIAPYLKTASIGPSPISAPLYLKGGGTLGSVLSTTAILNNGAFISTFNSGGNCTSAIVASVIPACAGLFVDVNGAKGPNQEGRDFFEFYILPNATLMPSGGTGSDFKGGNKHWFTGTSNYHCRPDTGGTVGRSCSGRIIEENWEMKY